MKPSVNHHPISPLSSTLWLPCKITSNGYPSGYRSCCTLFLIFILFSHVSNTGKTEPLWMSQNTTGKLLRRQFCKVKKKAWGRAAFPASKTPWLLQSSFSKLHTHQKGNPTHLSFLNYFPGFQKMPTCHQCSRQVYCDFISQLLWWLKQKRNLTRIHTHTKEKITFWI